jgi:hypothetical protein
MKHVFASVLFTLLVSGCAAKASALGPGGGAIPPRPAYATYPGWEHYCAAVDGGLGYNDVAARLLQDAGRQGWELVAIHDISSRNTFCFKRPLVAESAVAPATDAPSPSAAPVAEPPR